MTRLAINPRHWGRRLSVWRGFAYRRKKRPKACPLCKAPNFSYDNRPRYWEMLVMLRRNRRWVCSKCHAIPKTTVKKHISLFSGIGGFDLAADWAGWENVAHCEINPFGRKVLNYYWPNSISYENIKETDFTAHSGTIDVISGGFPCQPFSAAGKRKGTEDNRHLWPEMLRAIREIRPRWVVGENVRGLVNWSGGLVFEQVQSDLEAEGYEVQAFLIPAAGKDAPHRRDRIWFIAYSDGGNDGRSPRSHESTQGAERLQKRDRIRKPIESNKIFGPIANTNDSGNTPRGRGIDRDGEAEAEGGDWRKPFDELSGFGIAGDAPDASGIRQPRKEHGETQSGRATKTGVPNEWQNFPTQPPICGGNDGIPAELAGITFPKWRNESIKAYGNAVVPQVVFEIFKAINEYDLLYCPKNHKKHGRRQYTKNDNAGGGENIPNIPQ
jgi:DNA (cytosine-5)-methyltransferase 1